MIALLFFLAQAAQPALPPAEVAPMPPADWSALPDLRFRKPPAPASDVSAFVRDEVKAGRCAHAVRSPQGWTLKVDIAVLGTASGQARRIVPHAIDCPTVEQYASGLMSRMARDNVDSMTDAWYRTSLAFAWEQ